MQNNGELKFLDKYKIKINEEKDELFYYFYYDERNYEINKFFQHTHNFYEIYISLEDNISQIIEGRYFDLNKYDMVLLKPLRMHKSVYHPGTQSRRILINFSIPQTMFGLSGDLKKILSIFNADVPILRFSPTIRIQMTTLLNEIYSIHSNRISNNRLLIHAKFLEFLYLLYFNKEKNIFADEQTGNSITQKIYSVSSYIHLNLNGYLSLEDIADKFSISPCYLSHQFKEITGFTLVNYIQMARVREVQILLLNSTKQIKEIGEECGFNSFSQFNRVFRKYVEMSPSEFRKNSNSNNQTLLEFKEFD